MQQLIAPIISVSVYEPLPDLYRMRLVAPGLAAGLEPGQFLLAETETFYARRPFFPIAIDEKGYSLLLPPGNPLRRLGPGDGVDCIGPLGRGFPLPAAAQNLLLLAQPHGFGVAARQHGVTFLLALIDRALEAGRNVLLIHEAPTADGLFPPAGLPLGVEVRLVTADGSRGHEGTAFDLLPELAQWADQVYAVGRLEWYAALVDALREQRLYLDEGLIWGLIASEIMPCGMGVCGGCAVETRRGYRSPCVDGPVFDLTQV